MSGAPRPESGSERSGEKHAGGEAWLSRGPTEGLVAGVLRWTTRGAALALVVSLLWRSGRPEAAAAGVGVLLGAPFLATLSAAVAFGRERRWRLAAACVLLLLLVGAGAWLGARGGS